MIHIIQCDDPSLLPFARTRLGVLRGLGLAHISQKYDVGGVTVRVQKSGEHEYIWIGGGGGFDLAMDSGLVDIKSYDPENPAVFYPGTLYEAQSTYLYNLPFLPTDPVSDWRLNPAKINTGQIAGTVRLASGRFKGKVPYDEQDASCFSPGMETLGEGPPTPKVADDSLMLKKLAAALCPASIFTGRCRLWVQAMYGNPLYTRNTVARIPNIDPDTIGVNIAPGLLVPAYLPTGELDEFDPIPVTTSCGVVFEATTGTHWLIVPSMHTTIESNVVAYPLIGSANAERMRAYIKSTNTVIPLPEDRENLEAHILASCLPDPRRAKVIGTMTTPAGWYMGYGWHWNWAGTTAVIVANAQFVQSIVPVDIVNAGMRSARYTLSLTATPVPDSFDVSFTVSKAMAEQVDWAVDRNFTVLCEPNWATRMPAKTTSKYAIELEGDAPFYAFFIRDELKVCRIKNELIVQPTGTRTITPGYGDAAFGGAITESTFGTQNGGYSDIAHGPPRWTATVSCGGWSKSGLQKSWGDGGTASTIIDKTLTGIYGAGYGGTTAIDVDMEYGDSLPYSTVHVNYGATYTGESAQMTWADTHTTVYRTGWAVIEVVVPMNDAEALYVRTETSMRVEESGQKRLRQSWPAASAGSIASDGVWVSRRRVRELDPSTLAVISDASFSRSQAEAPPAGLIGWNLISTDNSFVADPVTTGESESHLFSHAGQTTVDFGSVDQFHNNAFEDIVANFTTLSGTRTDTPVVIATARDGTVGTHDAPTPAYVIVGQL